MSTKSVQEQNLLRHANEIIDFTVIYDDVWVYCPVSFTEDGACNDHGGAIKATITKSVVSNAVLMRERERMAENDEFTLAFIDKWSRFSSELASRKI